MTWQLFGLLMIGCLVGLAGGVALCLWSRRKGLQP